MKEYLKKSQRFVALVLTVLVAFTMMPMPSALAAANTGVAGDRYSDKDTAKAGYTLSGVVKDNAGKLVSGASVKLTGGTKAKTATTDKKGAYKFTGVVKGSSYVLTTSKAGYADVVTKKFSISKTLTKNVKLYPINITVSVKDEDGNVIKNAEVVLKRGSASLKGKTNASGKIVFEKATKGDYTGTITAESYEKATIKKFPVSKTITKNVEMKKEVVEVTVTKVEVKTAPTKVLYQAGEKLDLTGLVATLTMSDDTTEDVAFADFAAKGLTTTPANDAELTDTVTKVTITHTKSKKTAEQTITVNGTNVFSVSGTVTEKASNPAVAIVGAAVTLKQGTETVATTTTGADGKYTFASVPANTGYTIEISKATYETATIASFDVTDASVTGKNAELVKEAGISIAVSTSEISFGASATNARQVVEATVAPASVANKKVKWTISGKDMADFELYDAATAGNVVPFDTATAVTKVYVAAKSTLATGDFATINVSLDAEPAKSKDVYITVLPFAPIPSVQYVALTAPVSGATPVTAYTLPTTVTEYTGSVAWVGTPTIFKEKTAYTAVITLNAATGYGFKTGFASADVVNFPQIAAPIASASVARVSESKITITVVYEATPADDPVAIKEVSVAGAASLVVTTENVQARTITADDFSVAVNGAAVAIANVTETSKTSYEIALVSPLQTGTSVTVTGLGDLSGSKSDMYYTGKISGTVNGYYDNNGTITTGNLSAVNVTLLNALGTILKTTTTGTDGKYTLHSVPVGTYSVQFAKEGYSATIADSVIAGIAVTSSEATGNNKTLKSTNPVVQSILPNMVVVDGDVLKVLDGTTGIQLKGSLRVAYGDLPTIKVLSATGSTTEVTGAVTATNVVESIAQDGVAKKVYTVQIIASGDMGVQAVSIIQGTTVGTVSLTGTIVTTQSFKINEGAATVVSATNVSNVVVRAGDVITIWTGADATAAGKFKKITVKVSDIKAPATATVDGGNQEVKQGNTIKIIGIANMSGIELYASKAATKADFVLGAAARMTYYQTATQATLPAAITDGTYYLYTVHVASGAVSDVSTGSFKVDNVAPVLTLDTVSLVRTGTASGTVKFNSTETIAAGAGFGYIAKFGSAPTLGSSTGLAVTSGTLNTMDQTNNATAWAALTTDNASTLYIVAVDRAGNASQPLVVTVPAYNKSIPNAIYKVVTTTPASVTGGTTDIAISADGTKITVATGVVATPTEDFTSSAPNFAAVQKLLLGLKASDTFQIANGKIAAITKVATGTSDSTVTSLVETDMASTVTIDNLNTTNALKLSGSIGATNIQLGSTTTARYDFSSLSMPAGSVKAANAGLTAITLKVGAGTKVVTNAANAIKVNGVTFASGTSAIDVKVTGDDSFDVTNSVNAVTITAGDDADKVVNFVGTGTQTGALTINGATTVTAPATTSKKLTVTSNRNVFAAVSVLTGKNVDITGLILPPATVAVVTTPGADVNTTLKIQAGLSAQIDGKVYTADPVGDVVLKFENLATNTSAVDKITVVSGKLSTAKGPTGYVIPADTHLVVDAGATYVVGSMFTNAITTAKLIVKPGATIINDNLDGTFHELISSTATADMKLTGGNIESTFALGITARGGVTVTAVPVYTVTLLDDALVTQNVADSKLGVVTNPVTATPTQIADIVINGENAKYVLPSQKTLSLKGLSTFTVTKGTLQVDGTLRIDSAYGSSATAGTAIDALKIGTTGKLDITSTGTLGIRAGNIAANSDWVGGLGNITIVSGAVVSIANLNENSGWSTEGNTFYGTDGVKLTVPAAGTYRWNSNADAAVSANDVAGWKQIS